MADLRRRFQYSRVQRFLPSLLVAGLVPFLSGCVQPSVRPIVGPSGSPTLFISCAETGQCYELAGQSCPNGYDIQRAPSATVESYLVHCRSAPAPEQPTYYSAAPAYSQPAPQQAWAPSPSSGTPQPWAQSAPPPPPAPDAAQNAAASGAPNAMSMPRPIGSSEFDLGY
ncbi:MAG TPA: hypothetical protein VFU02_24180 [Polyangiaceae bacterium]|nr:hypothetical protein [Polyangiaceae bacterium]